MFIKVSQCEQTLAKLVHFQICIVYTTTLYLINVRLPGELKPCFLHSSNTSMSTQSYKGITLLSEMLDNYKVWAPDVQTKLRRKGVNYVILYPNKGEVILESRAQCYSCGDIDHFAVNCSLTVSCQNTANVGTVKIKGRKGRETIFPAGNNKHFLVKSRTRTTLMVGVRQSKRLHLLTRKSMRCCTSDKTQKGYQWKSGTKGSVSTAIGDSTLRRNGTSTSPIGDNALRRNGTSTSPIGG